MGLCSGPSAESDTLSLPKLRRTVAVTGAFGMHSENLTVISSTSSSVWRISLSVARSVFSASRSASLTAPSRRRSTSKVCAMGYSIVRMPEKPVISKTSMTPSFTPVSFMLPCLLMVFCVESSTRSPAEEM